MRGCSLNSPTCSHISKQKQKINFCTQHVLNLYFSGNSINNLLSYCGLTNARMRAYEQDLPVPSYFLSKIWKIIQTYILTFQAIPFCSWYQILSFLSSQRTLTNALHHSFSWILCQVDFRVIFQIVQAALLVNCDGSICTFYWVHDMFSRIFRIHTNLQTLSPIFFSWKRKQIPLLVKKRKFFSRFDLGFFSVLKKSKQTLHSIR